MNKSSNLKHINCSRSRLITFSTVVDDDNRLLKQGIWLYFLLLIFEGALRKWFLPGLAGPLLVIRDPLALALVFLTWKQGLLPSSIYLKGVVLIGIVSFFTAILFGHQNFPVALFGVRILIIQFPLIFVIGRVLNENDVILIGKAILIIAIPMAILTGLQFYSPQSSWVNQGVGGDMEGAGFSGAMGYFRPPGTFSFTNGNHLFFGLVSSCIFYFWLNPNKINRLLLIGATFSLLAAIPFSISRSLFFHVIISALFAVIVGLFNPQYFKQVVFATGGGIVALLVLGQTSFFQTAVEAFFTRFENASNHEGGLEGTLLNRYMGGLLVAFSESSEQPFFGYGIGFGTNVGSQLLTGERNFLIAEGEWGRIIGELGPLMGLSFIFLRLALSVRMVIEGYRKLLAGYPLPWMLLSFGLLIFPQGQWAQPTALGFSILIGGLTIASLRNQIN